MYLSLKSTLQTMNEYYGNNHELVKIEKIGSIADNNLKKLLADYGIKDGGFLLMQASAWSEFPTDSDVPQKLRVYGVSKKQFQNMFYNMDDNTFVDLNSEAKNPNGLLSNPIDLNIEQAENILLENVMPIPYKEQVRLEEEFQKKLLSEKEKVFQNYLYEWKILRYTKHQTEADLSKSKKNLPTL